jgi:hypothetical protein
MRVTVEDAGVNRPSGLNCLVRSVPCAGNGLSKGLCGRGIRSPRHGQRAIQFY